MRQRLVPFDQLIGAGKILSWNGDADFGQMQAALLLAKHSCDQNGFQVGLSVNFR